MLMDYPRKLLSLMAFRRRVVFRWKSLSNVGVQNIPDSKVHEANMGHTWVLSDPDSPHIGPINFAIVDSIETD